MVEVEGQWLAGQRRMKMEVALSGRLGRLGRVACGGSLYDFMTCSTQKRPVSKQARQSQTEPDRARQPASQPDSQPTSRTARQPRHPDTHTPRHPDPPSRSAKTLSWNARTGNPQCDNLTNLSSRCTSRSIPRTGSFSLRPRPAVKSIDSLVLDKHHPVSLS